MRCFVAIELPEEVRRELRALQSKLSPLEPVVRWTDVETLHLTVKFLGETPDAQLPDVCEALAATAARFEPFELEIGGTGCFPPDGTPRIVWAGVSDPPKPLLECVAGCEGVFAELGFPPESRAYRPHMTIGRVREGTGAGRVRMAVRAQTGFTAGRFLVTELIVFQSILGSGGAKHIPIARVPLGS